MKKQKYNNHILSKSQKNNALHWAQGKISLK